YACSAGGKHAYTYGDAFDASVCNTGGTLGTPTTVASPDFIGCHSPDDAFKTIFDLGGNVSEWEDSYREDDSGVGAGLDTWYVRGASYLTAVPTSETCASRFGQTRQRGPASDIGFRCCAY